MSPDRPLSPRQEALLLHLGMSGNLRAVPAATSAAAALVALCTFKANLLSASPADGPSRLAELLSSRRSEIEQMKAGLAAGESKP